MSQTRSLRSSFAVVVACLLLSATGCGLSFSRSTGGSAAPGPAATPSTGTSGTPSATPTAAPTPKKIHYPQGPPMLLDSIAPVSGTTVGVAMPISIVFSDPVKTSARAGVEKHLRLTTSVPVTGAWHWFGSQRVDFRPRGFWKSGTTVSLVAALDHVGDGYGRYGTHSYTRSFTIGADVRTRIDVIRHTTVVTRDGRVLRVMPSDAGNPQFPSWDGTMAVVEKSTTVRMTSCSVQITCDKKNPNFYDIVLPWDVRLTSSGTFVHYSTGDPYPGHSYGSHGCVHLSYANAEWYYNLSKQGDPITITGSPRGKAAGDNGYADYDVPWSQWLAGSGLKAFTTA